MTSREEALKVLEKAVELVAKATPGPWRWSENGNLMATGDRDVDEICAVYTERDDDAEPKNAAAIRAAVNFIRDHGPAILATASEQARYQKARDFDVFRMAGGDTECCPNPTFEEAYRCVCDLRSNYDELLASPAHTSEARDAARYRWMRRGLANTKLLPDGVADLFANALDQNDATKFDAAIDAAMRQEAGSRD